MTKQSIAVQGEFIGQINTILEERYSDEKFNVTEFAQSLALSRSQLHRKIKAATGKPVGVLLKEFRLKKAKRLLESGTVTVAEAGYQVGFGNPSYFNYCFSKYYGYPPGKVKYHSNGSNGKLNLEQGPSVTLEGNNAVNKWKALSWMLAITLVLILGLVLVQGRSGQTSPEASKADDEKALAVLPFVNLGNDPDGEYFAEGVRYEILDHLSRIEGLNVKSKLVVDRLEDSGTSIDQLVATLGLTHYLEASINKVDDQIRITTYLTNANTKNQIWSESYDHSYGDLLITQGEIAKKVAEAMKVNISPETAQLIKKKSTTNPDAWDDYLRATHYWRKFNVLRKPADLEHMVRFLKSSIKKDTNFALGYSNLAMAYLQVPYDPDITFNFINPDSVLILCDLAIELDSSLSDPYLRKAYFYTYYRPDTVAAVANYQAAISKGSHLAEPYWRYGNFHLSRRWDVATALKLIFQGLEKQPDSWLLARMLNSIGFIYMEIAAYDKAEYYYDKALVYAPDDFYLIHSKAYLYSMTLERDKQLAHLQKIMELSPLNTGLMGLGMYYLMVEDYEQSVKYFEEYYTKASETASSGVMHQNHNYSYALKKLGRLEEANEKLEIAFKALGTVTWDTDYDYAKIYAYRGLVDSAYYHLEKYISGDIRWGLSDHIEYDPLFENIRNEARFRDLVLQAKHKVQLKREEVQRLEQMGEIPESFNEFN
jgi:TolB-like protein/AraC-like DNA-binding protein/Tfp pilus assembly protein PilF